MAYTLGFYFVVEQPTYGKAVSPYNYRKKCMLLEVNHNSQCLITALNEINTNYITFAKVRKKIDILNAN